MRPLHVLALALGLVLSPSARADGLDGEIAVELGTLQNDDRAYDLFSEGNGMPSRGLRAGLGITDELALVVGWHRVRRGATVYLPDARLQSAFFADELTFGPKLGKLLQGVLFPYVTTQAMAFRGVMKLDDDTDTRHNPGQLRESTLTPGVLLMAGAELRSPSRTTDLALGWHLEMGYGWVGRGSYGAFGAMKPGGFAVRSGVGLHF